MKRFLFLTFCLLVVSLGFSQEYTFGGGSGTESDPYLIKTADHLQELATTVNSQTAEDKGEKRFTGKYFKLDTHITLTDDHTPIGTGIFGTGAARDTVMFNGSFDGNNKTIRNIKISGDSNLGLFGFVGPNGVVKNVTIQGVNIAATGSHAASVAAYLVGNIDNCHVTGGYINTQGGYTGGIAAQTNKATISNSSYAGSVVTSSNYLGTIAAFCWDTDFYGCHSSGDVYCLLSGSTTLIGGLVGNQLGLNKTVEMVDCYFTGTVSGSMSNLIGGLIGSLNKGIIERSWNAGMISVDNGNTSNNVGGLVASATNVTLRDCYNAGLVSTRGVEKNGGLIGNQASGTSLIENCLVFGNISISEQYKKELVEFAGGTVANVTITNSYFDRQVSYVTNESYEYALYTEELTNGSVLTGFDPEVWVFTEGMYPRLKGTENTPAAVLYSTPYFLADGEVYDRVRSDFTLANVPNVSWQMGETDYARLSGNTVNVLKIPEDGKEPLSFYAYHDQDNSLVRYFVIYLLPNYFKGEGTEESPYLITSLEDLEKLSYATNIDLENFSGKYLRLESDINMGLKEFRPISMEIDGTFGGVFDGNGKTISGFYLNTVSAGDVYDFTNKQNIGLFGYVGVGGVVKNLTMAADCDFSNIYRAFGPFVGSLAGTVENCYNYADVSATNNYCGGIVGQASNATAVIRNCFNAGTIQVKSGVAGGISANIGGLLENCQNDGNIIALTLGAGGITGTNGNNSIIRNVLNTGTVQGVTAGGIMPTQTGTGSTLQNAVSTGRVFGTTVAGIVTNTNGTIENIYFDKQISTLEAAHAKEQSLLTSELAVASLEGLTEENGWLLVEGRYPQLKVFQNISRAALASVPVFFNGEETINNVQSPAQLGQLSNLTWFLKEGGVFAISNNQLTVTHTDRYYVKDTLVATYDGYTRWLPIGSVPASTFNGSGTEQSPWLIENESDLRSLSDIVRFTTITYEGEYFRLVNDITMSNQTFEPIGNDKKIFQGSFDGNNKAIKNISIDKDGIYAGLFGNIGASGKLFDLTLTGNTISGTGSVGAFAGYLQGSIDNCHNYVTLVTSLGETSSAARVGGLVGLAAGNAEIKNSTNYGGVASYQGYAGGLVGYAKIASGNSMTIENSHNEGNVLAYQNTYAGGIVGNAIRTVMTNVSNKGNVIGASNYVGGIAGALATESSISNATNTGEITAGGYYSGGIIGNLGATSPVENVTNHGTVTSGSYYVGGIAGAMASNVKSAVNEGDVTSEEYHVGGITGYLNGTAVIVSQSYNTGTVTSPYNAGGIVGYLNGGTVQECFNLGDVTSVDFPIVRNYHGTGGIVGYAAGTAGKIMNCYNMGTITGHTAIASIIGKPFNASANKLTLTDTYSVGRVICTTEEGVAGPIYGDASIATSAEPFNALENNYYDIQAYGEKVVDEEEEGVLGFTTREMVAIDLGDVWTSVGENSYPVLANFADLDVVKLYAAPIFLSTEEDTMDTYESVTHNFAVSVDNDVTWSSDIIRSIEGTEVTLWENSHGDFTVSSSLGDLTRDITLAVAYGDKLFSGGAGVEERPYLISTTADLAELAEKVNEGESFEDQYFLMTNDIECVSEEGDTYQHTPIGYYDTIIGKGSYFSGVFDGNHKEIIDLNITGTQNVGLFGAISGKGVIKNLGLTVNEGASVKGERYVGAFAGRNYGTISGCYSHIPVEGKEYVGGLAGIDDWGALIENSYNAGTVSGESRVGGIIGTVNSRVESCLNLGNVVATGSYAGGLAGWCEAGTNEYIVFNSMNAGTITGKEGVGGLVGCFGLMHIDREDATYFDQYIYASYNVGQLSGGNTGSLIGLDHTGGYKVVENSYYDKQIAAYGAIDGQDVEGVQGLLTSEIASSSLLGGFDSSKWSFGSNRYPYPSALGMNDAVAVAISPVFLYASGDEYETWNTITQSFRIGKVSTEIWSTESSALKISAQNVTVTTDDTKQQEAAITATLGEFTKTIELVILPTPDQISATVMENVAVYATQEGIVIAGLTEGSYTLYDVAGTLVKAGNISSEKELIPVSVSGVYVLVVTNENDSRSFKVRL